MLLDTSNHTFISVRFLRDQDLCFINIEIKNKARRQQLHTRATRCLTVPNQTGYYLLHSSRALHGGSQSQCGGWHGLDLHNKPKSFWDTSFLTVNRHCVGLQVYQSLSTYHYVTPSLWALSNPRWSKKISDIYWDTFTVEVVRHLHQPGECNYSHLTYLQLTYEFPSVLVKKLSEIYPEREIKHFIQLKDSMPKNTPLYQLTQKRKRH